MLRTVSAGPQISLPGSVGFSVESADHAFRHAELVHHVRDQAGAFAERKKALDRAGGGFGVDCIRMRSAAIRPVSFLSALLHALLPPYQSRWIFAFRITADKRSVSSLMKARNCSGVLPTTSMPCSVMRARISGSCSRPAVSDAAAR